MNSGLRTGDLVEVQTATEILRSLDSNDAFDALPYIPDMMEFCGSKVSSLCSRGAVYSLFQSLTSSLFTPTPRIPKRLSSKV